MRSLDDEMKKSFMPVFKELFESLNIQYFLKTIFGVSSSLNEVDQFV